jgi:hypothetical protein
MTERAELSDKLEALRNFLTDQPRLDRLGVPADEVARLRRQHTYMSLYRDVLDERINAMQDKPAGPGGVR